MRIIHIRSIEKDCFIAQQCTLACSCFCSGESNGDPNSGPCACMAHTLLTGPFPWLYTYCCCPKRQELLCSWPWTLSLASAPQCWDHRCAWPDQAWVHRIILVSCLGYKLQPRSWSLGDLTKTMKSADRICDSESRLPGKKCRDRFSLFADISVKTVRCTQLPS